MSSPAIAIEQHVRTLIHDEVARAVAGALTPVVTEAAKTAAAETYRRLCDAEERHATATWLPIASKDAQRFAIEGAVRRSVQVREGFAFHAQDVRQACLSMALQRQPDAPIEETFALARTYEDFVLWGEVPDAPSSSSVHLFGAQADETEAA